MALAAMISKHPNPDAPAPSRHAAFDWVAEAPFYQAGLAGYSDAAMRLIARRHGCPYCVTEAMLDTLLIAGGRGLKPARITDDDHPIAGQIMGSAPDEMAAAAEVLLPFGFDVIDINLACPVKKIRKRHRGGHLLSSPDDAIAIVRAVRRAVGDSVPVTVKMRRAFDDTPEQVANFHRIFEAVIDEGLAGATVHSRTVKQKYVGPGRRPALAELTERYAQAMAGGFHIFGSGDVFTPQSIFQMIESTGVGAASVARGAIGDPWIFEHARALMKGEPLVPPTIHQQRDVLAEHFELSARLHGERAAGKMMRKFGIRFSRHHRRGDEVKDAYCRVSNLDDWRRVLDEFYEEDGPGTPIGAVSPDTTGTTDSCDPQAKATF